MIVVDTNVGAEIALKRKHSAWLGHIEEADWVLAPGLYIAEINNVFWKYHVYEDLPLKTCEDCIENAVLIPDEYVSETQLYRETFALACQTHMPVYDMLFLVLARRHNAALATMDRKLKKVAVTHSLQVL